ncbi:MAG TPA: hypothetical protein PL073_09490 [Spirochaetota bacterium]|nr:hypothetical protein [Spirochaetota bacterium]
MILKTDFFTFNNYLAFIILFIVHFCFCLQGNACEAFALHNGVIYLDSNTPLPVHGTVLDFTAINNKAILYVAKNEKEVTAGAYLLDEKKSVTCVIASINESSEVKRIVFDAPVVYISIHDSTNCCLYRADVNAGIVQQKEAITDFMLLDGGLAVLTNDNYLEYNDSKLPLYFLSKPYFKGAIDSRIVLVADTEATEVIDIVAQKPVYRYANNVQYVSSDNHTVEIALYDMPSEEKAGRVFYKIICDGVDYTRTEPGLSINSTAIDLNLTACQYHEIIIERWRLDETENKYIRDNNIRQPKPLTIYVYPGRVVVFTMIFNGTEYQVNSYFKVESQK